MSELLAENWILLAIALVVGLLVAWFLFRSTRRTRVTGTKKDVLDEGAERAQRNIARLPNRWCRWGGQQYRVCRSRSITFPRATPEVCTIALALVFRQHRSDHRARCCITARARTKGLRCAVHAITQPRWKPTFRAGQD